jgi:hypothetical protein
MLRSSSIGQSTEVVFHLETNCCRLPYRLSLTIISSKFAEGRVRYLFAEGRVRYLFAEGRVRYLFTDRRTDRRTDGQLVGVNQAGI